MSEFAAYLDDSGHPDDQEFVVVAGFVAEPSKWLQFEAEWNKALSPLSWFHATDFMEAAREWKDRERKKYLNRLAYVIESHTVLSLSDAIKMDDYRAVNAVWKVEESLGTPYAIAGRTVSGKLRQWQRSKGGNDCRISIYFDNGTKHKGDLIDVVQRDAFPPPAFLNKRDVPPLQAADLLAWMLFDAVKNNTVPPQLERLVSIGGQELHGIYLKENLIESIRKLPPNVSLLRGTSGEPIRFHSSPKKPRRRTIRDQR